VQKRQTIGRIGKFLMKAPDCIETPLMAAFGAAGAAALKTSVNPAQMWHSGNSTGQTMAMPAPRIYPAFHLAQTGPLTAYSGRRRPVRDGISKTS
jgi:hypothetical protein